MLPKHGTSTVPAMIAAPFVVVYATFVALAK
jgi:hypothetical protein